MASRLLRQRGGKTIRQTQQGGIDPGEERLLSPGRPLEAAVNQQKPRAPGSHGLRHAHVLRSVLAAALHGDLEVRSPQEWIEGPGFQKGGGSLRAPSDATEELLRLPRLQAVRQLLRKARRIARRVERLICQLPRHLVVAVTVPAGAAEDRHDHVGAKDADPLNDVRQNLLPGPKPKGLLGTLRVTEVEGPGEVLLPPVQASGRHQLAGPDQSQTLPELRADEVLSPLPSGQREIRGPGSHTPGERHQKARVLIVWVRSDHQNTLHAVQLPKKEAGCYRPPVLVGRLGSDGRGYPQEAHHNECHSPQGPVCGPGHMPLVCSGSA